MAEQNDQAGAFDDISDLDAGDEFGDVEAEDVPPPVPDTPYVDDPAYRVSNDRVGDEARGEDDEPGTPGAAGPEPQGVEG
jgi:hypothetical protein